MGPLCDPYSSVCTRGPSVCPIRLYSYLWPLCVSYTLPAVLVPPPCGLIFLIISKPLFSLLHYAPYKIYLSLLLMLPACVDATFPRHALITIKHLPFQTAHFWRPYSSHWSQRKKPNFRCFLYVSIHDSVCETSYFILYAVCIPLHLLII